MIACPHTLLSSVCCSACGSEVYRIEEMEKMLKEAQQEKARLMENRVSPRWIINHHQLANYELDYLMDA